MYIPPSFLAFHIPLMFVLYKVKITKTYMLFQPIKEQILLHFNNSTSYNLLSNICKLFCNKLLIELDLLSLIKKQLYGILYFQNIYLNNYIY